jgi:hypothetical protein
MAACRVGYSSVPGALNQELDQVPSGAKRGGAVRFGVTPDVVSDVLLVVVARLVMPSGSSALMVETGCTRLARGFSGRAGAIQRTGSGTQRDAQLSWPYNTDRFDQFIEQRLAEERAKKAALSAARRAQGAAR